MAYVIRSVLWTINDILQNLPDKRTQHLPLIKSPFPIIGILVAYLYFVKILGPKLMEHVKPFNLKNIMVVYNSIQVVVNLYIGVASMGSSYFSHYSLRCQNADYDSNPEAQNEIYFYYAYFLIKIFDLLDTIFIVLRKKWNQISFLHLYHHVGICFGAWLGVKFIPSGHPALLGILNCFVHVVMYFYYLVSSLNENMKNNLWWKKYITQIQILQFFILSLHFLGPVLFPLPSCTFPKWILIAAAIQNVFMLFMFSDFYVKAYMKKNKKS